MGCACSGNTAAPLDSPESGLPRLLGHQRKPSLFPKPGNWKLELHQVCEQLEARLQDPQFVATRCDLDGSGDLDMHELKQAARAFGLKFSAQTLEALMMWAPRISKAHFAEIVATSDNLPGHELVKLHRTIPHSLRGMALGQLEHLESLFVTSNWLWSQCESFNKDHADDIQDKKVYKQAPNLYAMDQYVVTPMSKPGTCPARKHDRKHTVPQATVQTSFSELLNAHGLYVHCFVSHFWGHLYSKTLQSLRLWSQNNFERMGCEQVKSMVFWICLFALNQHEVAEEVGDSPIQGPFNAALAQAEATVMIVDEEIHPFKRMWCLFEVHRLGELHKPFELICEVGSLSQPGAWSSDEATLNKTMKATCMALWKMSASEAEASVQKDKYQIWREIMSPQFQSTVDTVGVEVAFQQYATLGPLFRQFDLKVKSLLSTCMLHRFLAQADHCMAAQCCIRGARFNEEQLTEICANARGEESDWLSRMLCGAARSGSVAQVQLLLSAGADARGATYTWNQFTPLMIGGQVDALESYNVVKPEHRQGETALMSAAEGGHEDVARLLLESRADVSAIDVDGRTALFQAACNGHKTVSKLLLDHRADVAVQDQRGRTALMSITHGVHDFEQVAKLLLDHGADFEARDNQGTSALMNASHWGNVSIVRLLINHQADVEAADHSGCTALMTAAARCHDKVANMLLEHGATVGATGLDGITALMNACISGDEATTTLLLAGKADVAAVTGLGQTALHFAALNGHGSVTRLILEHGADVDSADTTPLMLAARGGHESVTGLLLKNRADVAAVNKDGNTALLAAANHGHAALAGLLIQNRASVDAASKDGATPLMLAAEAGHESVAKLLLNHQANVAAADQAGHTSLMLAAHHDREVVVKLLLEYRADVRTTTAAGTALLAASDRGHEAVTGLLLKSRADMAATSLDGTTPMLAAAAHGRLSIVKLLLAKRADAAAANSTGATALMLAAEGGHEDVATLLLAARGPGVAAANGNGNTPLMLAALGGHESVTRLLLKNHADVAAVNKDGNTALLLAAHGADETVTKLLLDHQANVEATRNYGVTPLMTAAARGHEAIAKLLLDHQANVAAADTDGYTSLMLAAQNGCDEVLKLLLQHRAGVEARDRLGNTALILAGFHGYEATSKLLLEHGAQPLAVNVFGFTAARMAARLPGRDSLVFNLRMAELAQKLQRGVPWEEATRGLISSG